MSYALSFAMISLVAAGGLDVVFKRYSRKDRSRGMLVFGCGIVWLSLQSGYFTISGTFPHFDNLTLVYGLCAGVVLVLANILLIESLTRLEVSMGSTIYRLNTIGVVVLSFLLLGEALGALKLTGIGLGIVAVLMLYKRNPGLGDEVLASGLFMLAAISASIFRAVYGVIAKSGLGFGADGGGIMLSAAICWAVGGLAYAVLRERHLRVTGEKIAYAIVSGLLVFIVANALIEALKYGEASIVVPVANLSFVVSMLVSVVIGMESLNRRKVAAMGCAAFSIFLLAQV